jgi:cytochrome P450
MSLSTSRALPLPPGTLGLPITGETQYWVKDPLQFARERYARHGLVWKTHLLGRPCVVMLGPEANRFVLSSHMHLFSSRAGWGRPITSLIGGGLSLLDGPQHRRHRGLIMPAMHGPALARYFDVMQERAAAHLARWQERGHLKLFEGFKHLTFDIAARLLLGARNDQETEAFARQFHIFTRGLFTFSPLAWRVPWMPYGRAWEAGASLRRVLREVIAERRRAPGETILDMLLCAMDEQGRGFTDDELVDELLVLVWAGHDTITSLLTWVMYELLRHPAIDTRLRAEQASVVGDGPLALPHLKQLLQLDRVLREAERLHPPAPGGFRGVLESFEYGGYHIPAGWTVMYSSVFTHHMPELWREPERFDPDRFAPPREEGKKPFHLIGFGGGPRVCVGLAFAQMEMRVVMSHLLRHARFALLPNQSFRPVPVPTKMPRDGLKVAVA